MRTLQCVLLVPIGLFAVYFDLRRDKIPNLLIVIGLILGWSFQLIQNGLLGVVVFFGGMGLPLVLGAVLYYFRMMGAGDIKLLAVAGGFLGPQEAVYCAAASLLVGAALSAVVLFKRKNLKKRLLYFYSYMYRQQTGEWEPYLNETDQDGRIHFAVAILGAILLYMGGVY